MSTDIAQPERMGVVITTYNSPLWLEKVLAGYAEQTDSDFDVLIADDGSGPETGTLIDRLKADSALRISHIWHEDDGFRKCTILNKVIAQTKCDYLIFTDGDCIPRPDFVATHRQRAQPGAFLSGGYIKLTTPVSEAITLDDIHQSRIFSPDWLADKGQPRSHKLWKLTPSKRMAHWLNRLTPTKATWNGMNSSTWTKDLVAVNGFNEDMQYGGLDRELGERLWHYGHRSIQIRYHAVCLHLDHPRGYAKPEIWARNQAIRDEVKRTKRYWAENGIRKTREPSAVGGPVS